MNKIDKIYYINLDRRPDRNTHFLNQCRQHDLPFSKIQRFQAVDGLTFNFTEQINRKTVHSLEHIKAIYSK